MKVLISDKISEKGLELLKSSKDLEVVYTPGISPEELAKSIVDAHALIVRSGSKVTADIIEKAKELKIIGRAGIGVDNIDVAAATERGIIVVNTPEGNATTAAEHTIAMMMSLTRHIPQANESMTRGAWEKSRFTGTEVTNKTLGVVGFGNIGKIVASRAQGLQMKVLVSDPYLTEEVATKFGVELVQFEDLCKRSDYITVHVPLNDYTRNLIDQKAFALMKKGVRIINCARGGVVNEEDLVKAIDDGKVSGAALDVFVTEPPEKDHEVLKHERIICTPHLGASTKEAQVNVAVQVAEQIRDYLNDGSIQNAINFPSVSAEMVKVLKPFIELCEKLGSFQGQISREFKSKIKQIDIDYCGTVCDFKTEILTSSILKTFLEPILDNSVNYINARNLAEIRGIRVKESQVKQVEDFANRITITVHGDKKKHLLAGTVFGKGSSCRIVRFDDFYLEVVPEGSLLIIHNYDRPGVVGKVGSLLGDQKINISRMQLALDTTHEPAEAVTFINIDEPADEKVQEKLMKLDSIIALYQVHLS